MCVIPGEELKYLNEFSKLLGLLQLLRRAFGHPGGFCSDLEARRAEIAVISATLDVLLKFAIAIWMDVAV